MSNLEEKLATVPKFDLSGYIFIKYLNSGQFGSTYLAAKDDEKIVIKKFFHHRDFTNIDELIEREIRNLSFCKHDQIVIGFKGISYTDLDGNPVEYPLLIQSYASNGSLGDLLKQKKQNGEHIDDVDKMIYLYGTAKSMQYLHNFHIVHRDLKPDNILIDENNYPLLADFGTSRTVVTTRTNEITAYGTPMYSAPEVFQDSVHENFSMASDVFSYGMLLYTLLTEKMPYEDIPNPTIYTISNFLENKNRFTLPNTVPTYFQQLISLCWNQEPSERPSFSQIIELFDAGIILPNVIQNEESKNKYFQYTQSVSNSGSFDKNNLIQLYTTLKNRDNKPKLAAIISFFLADFFNDSEYQTLIGRHYINGIVLNTNLQVGIEYLMKAAEQNNKEALFYLGQCYENGIGCIANREQSLDYFNRSAQLGFHVAINYLHKQEELQTVSKENAPEVIIIGNV